MSEPTKKLYHSVIFGKNAGQQAFLQAANVYPVRSVGLAEIRGEEQSGVLVLTEYPEITLPPSNTFETVTLETNTNFLGKSRFVDALPILENDERRILTFFILRCQSFRGLIPVSWTAFVVQSKDIAQVNGFRLFQPVGEETIPENYYIIKTYTTGEDEVRAMINALKAIGDTGVVQVFALMLVQFSDIQKQ